FELGSVSLEENSQKLPFNYQLPPDVIQQAINGNTQAGFLQDERSLVIRATGLKDGDARSIFKNARNDLRQYNRIRMWVHAEAVDDGMMPSNFTDSGDAKIFMRLGLDNDQNYYEYEIPLTPSNPTLGANNKANTWPEVNEFDFELALMAVAKAARNTAGTGLIYRHEYFDPETMPPGHRIYVKGTPKLSDVRNIMIGVRNPKDPGGQPVSLEVWVNELRLTNFDKSKGWAMNANASIKLADLGNVNLSGSYKTAGFGPLDQKLSTRAQEDVLRYDLAANVSLDKLLPNKWGLQMPVYATFGEQRINPIFNPQEADVRTDVLIDALPREEAQQKLSEIQDYKRTRSISFNNWRKIKTRPSGGGKGGGKGGGGGQKKQVNFPWDISNFDFTFAYNEQFARNAVIEKRFNTQHRGAINYRYQFPQLMVKPFKFLNNINFLKDKIGFVTDWGFSPWPNQVSVSVNGDRQFEERVMRPTSLFGGEVQPLFSKNFILNRNYSLNWNLTRNLQLNFTANNISRVDEVQGYWETASQQERDSVGSLVDNLIKIGRDPANGHDRLINMGRTTNYTHNLSVAYQLPTAQISWLNWINGTVNYTGSFNWQQAPEIQPDWGGSIGNTQSIQANARVDLNGLYRKFKFIQKILDSKPFEKKDEAAAAAGRPGAKGGAIRKPPAKAGEETPPDDATAEADTTKKDPFRILKIVGMELTKLILSVKNADLTYSANNGTILPGYIPQTDNFGIDWSYRDPFTDSLRAMLPAAFAFGDQRDIRGLAAQNYWISQDTTLSSLFTRNQQGMLTGRVSIEPIKGFRIDLSANRSLNQNESEFFRYDAGDGAYDSFDQQRNGNFTMSYIFA
ncbi:MAG: cell surface protein SprA, partial [Bacteroidota bacterium]